MDFSIYFEGFLATAALLVIEHAALYAPLKPRGDSSDGWRVLYKFALGVGAILVGCALIRWQLPTADPLLTPLSCSAAGLLIAFSYIGQWLFERAKETAYRRGRLAGIADHADILEDDPDGRQRKPGHR